MTREEAKEFIAQSVKSDIDMALIADAIKVLEQEPTTKNDLGVDLIPRADVLKLMQDNWHTHNGDWAMQESMDDIRALPAVTPQEPQSFKWCDTCKEYDQEKHCCHRYSKVIRDTVAEIEQEPTQKTCKSCRNFGSHNEVCDICNPKYNDLWREKLEAWTYGNVD